MNSLRIFKMGLGGLALYAAALFLSAPLHAQITQSISVTCTGSGQLCTPFYTTVVTAPQAGTMTLTYTEPNACATWRVHIYVDGTGAGHHRVSSNSRAEFRSDCR
jgi:hypothetical protein